MNEIKKSIDLIAISDSILQKQKQNSYQGFDPFDSLNSKLFNFLNLDKSEFLRLAWLQFHKRSPINFRPITLVPPMRNPKGIALFILGLLEDFKRTKNTSFLTEAKVLADWLLENVSDRKIWGHACWGYHFDWQARAFFVPKGKPNVISTSYISLALYRIYQLTKEQKYLDFSIDSAYFISKHLSSRSDTGELFFAYIPGEEAFVHNASLWAAATIARASSVTSDNTLKEQALEACRLSVSQQTDDGAWVYGNRHHHQFIDGFHTGYNLEAINIISESLETNEFHSSIVSGLNYYRAHFFQGDGLPKYYNNKAYPIDMHSSAQAILTFGQLQQYGASEDFELIERVMEWTIINMYIPKKNAFRYQINKYYNNNIEYVRWTQAWGYYALAYFNHLSNK